MTVRQDWRSRIADLGRRVYPRIDEVSWKLRRRAHIQRQMQHLSSEAAAVPWSMEMDRHVHVVVVPQNGPDVPNWHVAGGNLFFEVYQSAVELLEEQNVTLFSVGPGEAEEVWHRRLLEVLASTKATHLISQIEIDPNQPDNWSWDVVAALLERYWDGIVIGVMYDSAFSWLRLRTRAMGRILSPLLIVDLCEPIDGFVEPGRPEVGPITMPLSYASVDAIDAYVDGMEKEYDVSFIGALYDYRVELIDQLRAQGVNIVVNPHRADQTRTYDESRANQPTYLDFMAGLARSELTLNFSLASGGPHEQYKIRVQEASLVGCLCLTDDKDRSRLFFAPHEYAYFEDIHSLAPVITQLLADRDQLRHNQADARRRAHALARTDFWGRIDDGLRRRGLRELTGTTCPPAP